MPFTLQLGENLFRIVGPNGEGGDPSSYEEMAQLTVGDETYLAQSDGENGQVFQLNPVDTVIQPNVDFVFEDGEDEEDEDDKEEEDTTA